MRIYESRKGSAIARVKMRNPQTGASYEYTFKSNESVEVLNVEKKEMQYLYHDDKEVVFMDPATYEQAAVPSSLLEGQLGFLIPDMLVWVLWYEGSAIGATLPPHVILNIMETEDAVAGGTVNAPKKSAIANTGVEIKVPLFVKVGDRIEVDTGTGEYISRAN